jgi:DNA-binding HxlR family transcriptional regulator
MGLLEPPRRMAEHCSLPAALSAMGERWSFMILRASFGGIGHFEGYQRELGIARNILANRLGRLVDHGILEREPCADDRRRVEYRLTEKGRALLPALVALRQWGERWGARAGSRRALTDARDGQPVAQVRVMSHDGRELTTRDLEWAALDERVPVTMG